MSEVDPARPRGSARLLSDLAVTRWLDLGFSRSEALRFAADERHRTIIRASAAGASDGQIAAALGISVSRVRYWRTRKTVRAGAAAGFRHSVDAVAAGLRAAITSAAQ